MKPIDAQKGLIGRKWRLFAFMLVPPLMLLMGLITNPPRESNEIQKQNGVVDVDALIKKVKTLNQEKKHQKAIDLLTTALDQENPDSLLKPLLLQTFDLFLENEIRAGEQEIKANTKNIKAYLKTASALELLDSRYKALELLVAGISINPEAHELWMKIGKLEHKSERNFEAFDVYKEVIRLDPENSDAYNNAAFVLAKAPKTRPKDLENALTLIIRARKLDPENPEYLDTMAEIVFRQGNPAEAQNLIKEAIKKAPSKDIFKAQLKRFSQQ